MDFVFDDTPAYSTNLELITVLTCNPESAPGNVEARPKAFARSRIEFKNDVLDPGNCHSDGACDSTIVGTIRRYFVSFWIYVENVSMISCGIGIRQKGFIPPN